MVEIALPSLPANWPADKDLISHRAISAPLSAYIEPVGRWFEAHANRRRRGRTLSQDEEEQMAMKAEVRNICYLLSQPAGHAPFLIVVQLQKH
jgi:DnaJ family protein C protein 2